MIHKSYAQLPSNECAKRHYIMYRHSVISGCCCFSFPDIYYSIVSIKIYDMYEHLRDSEMLWWSFKKKKKKTKLDYAQILQ